MSETEKTRKICKEMIKCGAVCLSLVAGKRQQPGLPDRIIWHKDWQGFIEFKDEKTKTRLVQIIMLEQLNFRKKNSAFIVRFPNRIETPRGLLLKTFEGSGRSLLSTLLDIIQQD